jgi:hypothetical protein
MNTEAMLAVADLIEQKGRVDLSHFSGYVDVLGAWTGSNASPQELLNDCNTVGCIAGWACAWAGRVDVGRVDYEAVAQEVLGLTDSQVDLLFYGMENFWEDHLVLAALGTFSEEDLFDLDVDGLETNAKVVAAMLRKIASGEIELATLRPWVYERQDVCPECQEAKT